MGSARVIQPSAQEFPSRPATLQKHPQKIALPGFGSIHMLPSHQPESNSNSRKAVKAVQERRLLPQSPVRMVLMNVTKESFNVLRWDFKQLPISERISPCLSPVRTSGRKA